MVMLKTRTLVEEKGDADRKSVRLTQNYVFLILNLKCQCELMM